MSSAGFEEEGKLTFDLLPPDVIVSEILIHIVVGQDIVETMPERHSDQLVCFGRFNRDRLRYRWTIFRNVMVWLPDAVANRFVIPIRYLHSLVAPSFSIRSQRTQAAPPQTLPSDLKPTYRPARIRGAVTLRSVSSRVLEQHRGLALSSPNLDTLVLQSSIDRIPDWCRNLQIMPHVTPEDTELRSGWMEPTSTPYNWAADRLFTRYRPNLVSVELKTIGSWATGYRGANAIEVVNWDLANAPNLRKMWFGYVSWRPVQAAGGPPQLDFFRLWHTPQLDALKMDMKPDRDAHSRWYLPPVTKKLNACYYNVAAGYVIPPSAEFYWCHWDPTHNYKLYRADDPSYMNDKLTIARHPEQPYQAWGHVNAVEAVELGRTPNSRFLAQVRGRLTVSGNVKQLRYYADDHVVAKDSEALQSIEKLYPYVGRSFEFVFNGNADLAIIKSNPDHRWLFEQQGSDRFRNTITLNGSIDHLHIRSVKELDLTVQGCRRLTTVEAVGLVVNVVSPSIPEVVLFTASNKINVQHVEVLKLLDGRPDDCVFGFTVDLFVASHLDTARQHIHFLGKVDMAVVDECIAGFYFDEVTEVTILRTIPKGLWIRKPQHVHVITFKNITTIDEDRFRDMAIVSLLRDTEIRFEDVDESVQQQLLKKFVVVESLPEQMVYDPLRVAEQELGWEEFHVRARMGVWGNTQLLPRWGEVPQAGQWEQAFGEQVTQLHEMLSEQSQQAAPWYAGPGEQDQPPQELLDEQGQQQGQEQWRGAWAQDQ